MFAMAAIKLEHKYTQLWRVTIWFCISFRIIFDIIHNQSPVSVCSNKWIILLQCVNNMPYSASVCLSFFSIIYFCMSTVLTISVKLFFWHRKKTKVKTGSSLQMSKAYVQSKPFVSTFVFLFKETTHCWYLILHFFFQPRQTKIILFFLSSHICLLTWKSLW